MSTATDAILRGLVGGALGAPADIAGLLNKGINALAGTKLATELPGGSESIGNVLQEAGLVSELRNPGAELLASILPVSPAAAAKTAAIPLASLLGAMTIASKGRGAVTANKQAGTIGGKVQIERADLHELAGEAEDIYKKAKLAGKTEKQAQFAVGRHTEEVLKRSGNPYGIQSFFFSPYGEIQAVIDDSTAKVLAKQFRIGKLTQVFPPSTSTKLPEFWEHPNLYQLSPELAETTIVSRPSLGVGGGEYTPSTRSIAVGQMATSSRGLAASRRGATNKTALELLDETLRHEATHVMAKESGVVSRGVGVHPAQQAVAVERILAAHPNSENAKALANFLGVRGAELSPQSAASRRIYDANYGEWVAEAGAKYAPTTLPGVIMPIEKLW